MDRPELLQGPATSCSHTAVWTLWCDKGVQPRSLTQPRAINHQGRNLCCYSSLGKTLALGWGILLGGHSNLSPPRPQVPQATEAPHSLVFPVVVPIVATDVLNPRQKVIQELEEKAQGVGSLRGCCLPLPTTLTPPAPGVTALNRV